MGTFITFKEIIDKSLVYFERLYKDYYQESAFDVSERINRGECYVMAYYLHAVGKKYHTTNAIYTSYYHVFIMSGGMVFDSLHPEGAWAEETKLPPAWENLYSLTPEDVYKGNPFLDEETYAWYFNEKSELVLFLRKLLSLYDLELPSYLLDVLKETKNTQRVVRMKKFINLLNNLELP